MNNSVKISFCKEKTCPATDVLLALGAGELAAEDAGFISEHLSRCEFCCAEAQFLAAYPPREEKIAPPEMPSQLRQLAEILLGDRKAEFQLLKRMFESQDTLANTKIPLSA